MLQVSEGGEFTGRVVGDEPPPGEGCKATGEAKKRNTCVERKNGREVSQGNPKREGTGLK